MKMKKPNIYCRPTPATRKLFLSEFKNCGFTNYFIVWGENGFYAVTYGKTVISCLNEIAHN